MRQASRTAGSTRATSVITEEGPMLVDFSAATRRCAAAMLDIDVAELLVACTVLVGPERALARALRRRLGGTRSRVYFRICSAPHSRRILRDLARSHEVGLKDLRTAAASAARTEPPEIVPLRRIRPKDLLLMAALILAAYLLISQLADIGFGTIADELRDAELAWVVVALGPRRRSRSSRLASRCEAEWRRPFHSCPASCFRRPSSSST